MLVSGRRRSKRGDATDEEGQSELGNRRDSSSYSDIEMARAADERRDSIAGSTAGRPSLGLMDGSAIKERPSGYDDEEEEEEAAAEEARRRRRAAEAEMGMVPGVPGGELDLEPVLPDDLDRDLEVGRERASVTIAWEPV